MKQYIDIPKKLSSSKFKDIELLTGKDMVVECVRNIIFLEDGESKMVDSGVNMKAFLLKINNFHNMLTLTNKLKNEIKKINIVNNVNIVADVKKKLIKIDIMYKEFSNTQEESLNFNLREIV